jgi:hypothetical protein
VSTVNSCLLAVAILIEPKKNNANDNIVALVRGPNPNRGIALAV